MRSCELLTIGKDSLDLRKAEVMPTVCLLALPLQASGIELKKLVHDCLSAGAIFFAVWGEGSDAMEDEIDFILAETDDGPGHIPTTSHSNESVEDTANFVVNAAYLDEKHFRVLVVTSGRDCECQNLVESINKLCSGQGDGAVSTIDTGARTEQ